MIKQNDRNVVVLKKIWIGLSVAAAVIFLTLIFYNFYKATQTPMSSDDSGFEVHMVANDGDTAWYHKEIESRNNIVKIHQESNYSDNKKHLDTDQKLIHDSSPLEISPDVLTAMAAPIDSNQLVKNEPQLSRHQLAYEAEETSNKAEVILSDLKNPINYAINPYIIQVGTLIPGILMTGIHSDLPGPVIAQVRAPVYDSISGENLLIPQGSKLIGAYDSQIAYGQERLSVVWKRLILPNGKSFDLESMPGVDERGMAGFYDHTNYHYSKLLGSAVLSSVLSAGSSFVASNNSDLNAKINPAFVLAKSSGETVAQTGARLVEKNMDIQPTLEIRAGYHFQLAVTRDMVFSESYQEKLS